MPRKKYEPLDDAAVDRIKSSISDWSNPKELKAALQERFPKWKDDKNSGFKRFEGFTKRILEREQWFSTAKGIRYTAVEDRTGTAGVGKHRFEMVTDAAGKYLGKRENLKIYSRHGNIYGLNKLTGRRAKIA